MKAVYTTVVDSVTRIINQARLSGRSLVRIELEPWEWDEFYAICGHNLFPHQPDSRPGEGVYMGVRLVCIGTVKGFTPGGTKW